MRVAHCMFNGRYGQKMNNHTLDTVIRDHAVEDAIVRIEDIYGRA